MSTLFFDHLIVVKNLDKRIKKVASSNEEMQEIWKLIDELLHTKIFECCLGNLPEEHHKEFLEKFHKAPYDKELLDYLTKKIGKDVSTIIKSEIKILKKELLKDLKKK